MSKRTQKQVLALKEAPEDDSVRVVGEDEQYKAVVVEDTEIVGEALPMTPNMYPVEVESNSDPVEVAQFGANIGPLYKVKYATPELLGTDEGVMI